MTDRPARALVAMNRIVRVGARRSSGDWYAKEPRATDRPARALVAMNRIVRVGARRSPA